jgi:hypothetical protein
MKKEGLNRLLTRMAKCVRAAAIKLFRCTAYLDYDQIREIPFTFFISKRKIA